jgi:hypothetical protein
MELKQLGDHFNCNKPTNESLIKEFELQSRILLPKDYADFLCCANGGEGFVSNGIYIILWHLEDLLKLNLDYQVAKYAPGLFLFGSDGGGEAFAFDMRQQSKPIISVPFVGMSLNDVQYVCDTFTSFINKAS